MPKIATRPIESLESRVLLTAQLLKDIEPAYDANIDRLPDLVALNTNTALFVYDDGLNGPRLWKTGGTAATTQLVKDVDGAAVNSCKCSIVVNSAGLAYLSVKNSARRS